MLLWLSFWSWGAPIQVDLHLDTPSQLYNQNLSWHSSTGLEAGLAQLRRGGTNVPVMVLFPPREVEHLAHSRALLEKIEREAFLSEMIEIAHSPREVRNLIRENKTAVLISMEGAHGLGDGDWRLPLVEFHQRGLSMLGLSWSFSTRFGGSSGDRGGGLTTMGKELVKEAQSMGILIDLSHSSRAVTMEVCSNSPVPVVASHSAAYALQPVPRNLLDREIVCIARTGGVIGINFHAPFLGKAPDLKRVADHVEHIAKVGGYASVALGTDFDGWIRTPKGLENASALPKLFSELRRRGWSEEQLRGFRGENFLRAWDTALQFVK
ncbi:MAG: membrane dipeptidase [Myxococcota bacterium]|nr:membrane dipeptidase [Myxococcota bacterium]